MAGFKKSKPLINFNILFRNTIPNFLPSILRGRQEKEFGDMSEGCSDSSASIFAIALSGRKMDVAICNNLQPPFAVSAFYTIFTKRKLQWRG